MLVAGVLLLFVRMCLQFSLGFFCDFRVAQFVVVQMLSVHRVFVVL